jgi:hypothetical protein
MADSTEDALKHHSFEACLARFEFTGKSIEGSIWER